MVVKVGYLGRGHCRTRRQECDKIKLRYDTTVCLTDGRIAGIVVSKVGSKSKCEMRRCEAERSERDIPLAVGVGECGGSSGSSSSGGSGGGSSSGGGIGGWGSKG